MEYKIGDISRLFNLSNEMIRYYEKHGIIHPYRDEKNGYRYYTIFDVYSLFESLQYQQLGVKIKAIPNFTQQNHFENLKKALSDRRSKLESEIIYKELLCQRLKEIADQVDVLSLNVSNYWIKKINKKYTFSFIKGKGDQYGSFLVNQENVQFLLVDKYISFLESYVAFCEEVEEWYFAIEEKYFDQLGLIVGEKCNCIPEHYCLCTIIDMGDIGSFNKTCYQEAITYARQRGYQINEPIRGSIIGRGFEDSKYTRYMELQIPIELPPSN